MLDPSRALACVMRCKLKPAKWKAYPWLEGEPVD